MCVYLQKRLKVAAALQQRRQALTKRLRVNPLGLLLFVSNECQRWFKLGGSHT